ncbi:hypothetical protein Hte_004344 [Hypoxylon texense]
MHADDGDILEEEEDHDEIYSFALLAAQLDVDTKTAKSFLRDHRVVSCFVRVYDKPVLKHHSHVAPVGMRQVAILLYKLYQDPTMSLESLVAQNPHDSVIRSTEFIVKVPCRLTNDEEFHAE